MSFIANPSCSKISCKAGFTACKNFTSISSGSLMIVLFLRENWLGVLGVPDILYKFHKLEAQIIKWLWTLLIVYWSMKTVGKNNHVQKIFLHRSDCERCQVCSDLTAKSPVQSQSRAGGLVGPQVGSNQFIISFHRPASQ